MKSSSWFRRAIASRFKSPNSQIHFTSWSSLPSHNLELESIKTISENPFFRLLNICRTLSSLRNIHALLIVTGEANDPLLKNKLVGLYGQFGQSRNARNVFDEMPDPDFEAFKVMIRWYFLNDLYSEVIEFHRLMRRRFLISDNVVFSIVLKACAESTNFSEGRMVHCNVVHVGSFDSFVLSGLVDMYAKCGEIDAARKVFEMIGERNVVCWTSMIVGYVENGCAEEGLLLFNRMRDCMVDGNSRTLASLATACAKLRALHQGKWVHGNVIKNGIKVVPFLSNSLVNMYIKCGSIRDARLAFDEFGAVDLVSWTAMIKGYAENGFAEDALELFLDEKWVDVYPNEVTLASVVSSCAQLRKPIVGSSGFSLAIKLGQDGAIVKNALVKMYGKCGRIDDAESLFESIFDKDVVSWNLMIGCYSENGYGYKALKLSKTMRSSFVKPNAATVVALLLACGSTRNIGFGAALHAYSIREGFLAFDSDFVGTALLSFYAEFQDAKSARDVFVDMMRSAMIGGYEDGERGVSTECVALFDDLGKENVEPADIVFVAILSTCSDTGMIREGWRFFKSVCRGYKFVPSMRHYGCVVDLLARSGCLEEALEFFETMPVKPDSAVLRAFIHQCSVRSRMDLRDLAVRKMKELHPDDARQYESTLNFDSSRGRRSRASDLVEKNDLKEQTRTSWSINHSMTTREGRRDLINVQF
ncbi:pentatricopeptide repeat-containing protein At2g03380, mitochondrial [Andrographis paniculata]|uniref:pentatricopeptide repeat-containing protein At2g03380, mitochondrial n=1 Tax=Andrographis paniculata TaxID=175694 RepID=UPI0021E89546|nr:pentatricopeptide repeat-containing protein At2g03380, mitochondrial [Andrographis paniculata]